MKEYNGLVRDKLPEIIKKEGKEPIVEILSDGDYKKELKSKLIEEVNKYVENEELEALGDAVEVVLAILKNEGSNLGELIEYMDEKRDEKGGFINKIYLKGVK